MANLLTNEQAMELYTELRMIHLNNSGWTDKVNALRSVFDRMLTLEVLVASGQNKISSEMYTFQNKIEYLERISAGHNKKLEPLRNTFNEVHHSTCTNGYKRPIYISRRQYLEILGTIISHIAHVSGVPTLPELSLALAELKRYCKADERFVLILCQLYSSYSNILDGMRIVKEYDEFMNRKKIFGLENIQFTLMVYSTPFTFSSDIKNLTFPSGQNYNLTELTESSLRNVLGLLKNYHEMPHSNCPWLIWICSEVPSDVDQDIYRELKKYDKEGKLVLYPVYTTDKAKAHFEMFFSGHEPKSNKLNPNKADRFFNSIALTLQRASKK